MFSEYHNIKVGLDFCLAAIEEGETNGPPGPYSFHSRWLAAVRASFCSPSTIQGPNLPATVLFSFPPTPRFSIISSFLTSFPSRAERTVAPRPCRICRHGCQLHNSQRHGLGNQAWHAFVAANFFDTTFRTAERFASVILRRGWPGRALFHVGCRFNVVGCAVLDNIRP